MPFRVGSRVDAAAAGADLPRGGGIAAATEGTAAAVSTPE